MKRTYATCLTAALATMLLGGCPGITITLPNGDIIIPGTGTVVVEVFNDTDYEVDPRIAFDDDAGFWAGALPSEELVTGILAPGELGRYNMDCDQVGSISSRSAGQFYGSDTIGQADSTRTLERRDDYDCGDTIQFHFIGDGDGFGVIVSVNGVVVD